MTDKTSAVRSPLSLVKPPKKTRAEDILANTPTTFDFNETEVLRMGGGSAANGDKNDPIVFTGHSELWMRRLIAKYGFDRMPLTYGEFQAFLEYCSNLDGVIGAGVVPSEHALNWAKAGGIEVWEKYSPKYKEAARLFATKDIDGLRKFHKDLDAMTQLGKDFKEFED